MRPSEGAGGGRLKIFLGSCAGVGKTYAMLEAARTLEAEGLDLVVGWVDTHGRAETEAMLGGLELLPRKRLLYRNTEMEELDLDRVLERRPRLVLVDELAHSNVPGSRHRKRWQDVEELLRAGIDVYTTLNIQHLESLNDVVSQITGVRVRETVPDRVLDEAEEIQLIDLHPDELLQRLREGKVYVPAQARQAAENFFEPGKLAALRELALRRAAERVDSRRLEHAQALSLAGPREERLLVCVGPSPFAERLIRVTKRLATQLKAPWEAIYVESEDSARMGDEQRDRLEQNLGLAESLGAHTARLSGESVAGTALEFARSRNVTKIVCGRSRRAPGFGPSLSHKLIEESPPIDVLVVTGSPTEQQPRPPGSSRAPNEAGAKGYLTAAAFVAATTLLGKLIDSSVDSINLAMFYLLATVLTALRHGRAPAVLCATLGVLAFDFFFVQPRYTFAVSDTQYLVTFGALLAVGIVVGSLTARAREQAGASRRSELELLGAYSLGRDLAQAADEDAIVEGLVKHLSRPLEVPVTVFLPRGHGLEAHPRSAAPGASCEDLAVAEWVMRNGRVAGCGTDTLPAVGDLFFPLRRGERTLGVLRLHLQGRRLPSSQRHLLETLTNLTAMALERVNLSEEARRAQLLEESDRLQSALLNSISHDLQTPVTSITGCLDGLADPLVRGDRAARQTLIQSALEQAERLHGLVINLLDMTRVESGQLGLHKAPCSLADLLDSALSRLEEAYRSHPLHRDLPDSLPPVPVDFAPFSQVLYNLLENAAKYSPPGAPVDVCARVTADGGRVELSIADRGPGIPAEERERVFEKFYRLPGPVSGTGLGLAICRALVELHGGKISALEREGGGSLFRVEIPL